MKKIISNSNYYNHLEITEKKLNLLVDDLRKYFGALSIEAELKNKHEIEFENLAELFQYDNFKENRIVRLTIRMRKNIGDILRLYIYSDGLYSYYLELDDNLVSENVIIEKLDLFRKTSTVISKIFSLLICIMSCLLLFFLIYKCIIKKIMLNEFYNKHIIIFSIIITIIIICIYDKIENYFLPNTTFLWGDETRRIEKMKKIRNWVIGIITTIVITLIFKMIS